MNIRFQPERRQIVQACAVALALAAAPAASAQSWPAKPISVVVPFAPGGTTDALVRSMAERLAQGLSGSCRPRNLASAWPR